MSDTKMALNPYELRKKKGLTKLLQSVTIEGGTEGSDDKTPEAQLAASADGTSDLEDTLATLLAAMLDMWDAYKAGNRKSLDGAYESLVTELEVLRDGTPKI